MVKPGDLVKYYGKVKLSEANDSQIILPRFGIAGGDATPYRRDYIHSAFIKSLDNKKEDLGAQALEDLTVIEPADIPREIGKLRTLICELESELAQLNRYCKQKTSKQIYTQS